MRTLKIFLLVLLLTACGARIDAPASLPAGYTIATGDRVALAMPGSWTAAPVAPGDFARTADYLQESNPALAQKVEIMAGEIDEDTLRFVAYHESGLANVNISAERIPRFMSLATIADDSRQGLEAFGYSFADPLSVPLNGQNAILMEGYITLNTTTGQQIDMSLIQYTLISGDTAYTISFGGPAYQLRTLRDEIEQIVQTFHTVD